MSKITLEEEQLAKTIQNALDAQMKMLRDAGVIKDDSPSEASGIKTRIAGAIDLLSAPLKKFDEKLVTTGQKRLTENAVAEAKSSAEKHEREEFDKVMKEKYHVKA